MWRRCLSQTHLVIIWTLSFFSLRITSNQKRIRTREIAFAYSQAIYLKINRADVNVKGLLSMQTTIHLRDREKKRMTEQSEKFKRVFRDWIMSLLIEIDRRPISEQQIAMQSSTSTRLRCQCCTVFCPPSIHPHIHASSRFGFKIDVPNGVNANVTQTHLKSVHWQFQRRIPTTFHCCLLLAAHTHR